MIVTRERICPGKARQILRTVNPSYRPIRMESVMVYAAVMRYGDWMETIDAEIMIDDEHGLIDGRRRLAAVVEAGVAVHFIVRRGSFQ